MDEEYRDKLKETIEEIYQGVSDERDIRFWEGGIVRSAPTGPPEEYIAVEIQGIYDGNVLWRGIPPAPAVGDEVLVWEDPNSKRREIIAASGTTGGATLPVGTQGFFWKTNGVTNNWRRLAQHTCHVGPGTECEAATLGAAVAIVNIAGPPDVNNPWVILVDAIITAEAGNVTIPSYCYVVGRGEGSVVGMGANRLILSSNSGLEQITVTSSDATDAIRVDSASDVVLRDVKITQGAAASCLRIIGTGADVRIYDCVAEVPAQGIGFYVAGDSAAVFHTCTVVCTGAYDAATYGFRLFNTAVVVMDYCCADDSTNLGQAFRMFNTVTCTTRWCTFRGHDIDVQTGATVNWYYLDCHFDPDNSSLSAGTHHALSTKRFNQILIVAEEGGDFQALSEAVAFINAQADAAAGKLYGIEIKVGNFAEAASVTMPQYVHVEGMGEGTEIEMAAGTQLIMSSDTSLANVVVEGSPTVAIDLIYANNASNVVLRNVRAVNSTMLDRCFHFAGSTTAEVYHCIAETTASGAYGFYISGTANVRLEDCIADDTTNFAEALSMANSACFATTVKCTFRAATDDVTILAAATWYHQKCYWDANNSTIAGTETPLPDGAVEIHSAAIRGHSSLYPDLGTTTATQRWGHVYLAPARDLYPDTTQGMGWPLVRRWIEPYSGAYAPYDHFRSGVIPTGFAWAGAPFNGVPATLAYSYSSDYMLVRGNGVANRHFLFDTINNVGGDWQNKSLWARVRAGINVDIGIRIDDGDDNDYVQIISRGRGLGAQEVYFEHRDGGGAVTAHVIDAIDIDHWLVMWLWFAYSAPNYTAYGFVVAEDGKELGPTNWTHGIVWCPAAGRLGIIVEETGYQASCDWFDFNFGMA